MHNVSSTTEEKEGVWSLRGGGCLGLCPRPVGTSGTVDVGHTSRPSSRGHTRLWAALLCGRKGDREIKTEKECVSEEEDDEERSIM